jgi:16S rRNA (cytosine1402-N4)-methyltransferase
MSEFVHIPVLYKEVLEGLNVKPEGVYVDGTLGGGGHAKGIAERLTTGRLIANDLDPEAIAAAKEKLGALAQKVIFVHDDYKNITKHLDEFGIDKVDGILLDLGVSSYQIDTAERGFSYMKDAPLDMRMDRENGGLCAADIVNHYSAAELTKLFEEYGEEKFAKKIASDIVRARVKKPIQTTGELSELICATYPVGFKFGHPAKRVFQALRIETNGELEGLYKAIEGMTRRLKPGGRMCVITFHSLEDRIVKTCFKQLEIDCVCDKNVPVCVCGKVSEIKLINKKPIEASEEELKLNKRAESAKLRIIEKK